MDTDRPTTRNRKCTHRVGHYHGTLNGYTQDKCRCPACFKAGQDYRAGFRERARAFTLGPRWEVRSPEWLAVMREGLRKAVEAPR